MTRRRTAAIIVAALASLCAGGTVHAAAASKPRVAYLGSRLVPPDPLSQKALDAGVVAGLRATSVVYIEVSTPERTGAAPCTSEACVRALSSRLGIEYFVFADAQLAGDQGAVSYRVAFQLLRPAPFGVALTADFNCEACIPESLGQKADITASSLMASLVKSLEAPAVRAPGPPPEARPGTSPATDGRSTWPIWTVAAGGAGVLAGLGIALFVGETSGCPGASSAECFVTRDYRPLGYSIAGSGAVAAALGGYFLLTAPGEGSHRVSLAIVPGGLALGGSF